MTKNKPLKRHKALVALSRDHHFGLLLCWKLRKGLAEGISPKRMAAYLQYFFRQHLMPHFQLEEEVIFPTLPKEDKLRVEAERQHRELYQLVKQVEDDSVEPLAGLKAFEEQLERHIRFEERELFMNIQAVLTERDLQDLQVKVEAGHAQQEEKWDDRFWE